MRSKKYFSPNCLGPFLWASFSAGAKPRAADAQPPITPRGPGPAAPPGGGRKSDAMQCAAMQHTRAGVCSYAFP